MQTKIRIFIQNSINEGNEIILKDKDYHYAIKVMRAKLNDGIIIISNRNGEFFGTIIAINKKDCTIKINSKVRSFQETKSLFLAFAPIKRIEMIAEKGTELGITDFIPIQTRRTIVSKVNSDKFLSHVKEAVEQCERLDMPSLHEIIKLPKFLEILQPNDILIFCNERTDSTENNAIKVLQRLKQEYKKNGNIYILVGPEGGFSTEELFIIENHKNAHSISLGSNILRAETAVISAITLVKELML